MGRYFRLLFAFARFGLAAEMSFRANFIVKLLVEALWLGILLVFYDLLFTATDSIASWDRNQYLFFVGCHYALGGVIEAFFLENCTGFPELVRSGELDQYLLKPIDEQFLVTCRSVDWSTLPNILQGVLVMLYALWMLDWPASLGQVLAFLALFACGVAMAYSLLLMLCSTSVWMVRNQSMLEMWWLFTTLMRYPRDIYTGYWASPVGFAFTYVLPVLLVVYVPATTMVKGFEPGFIALAVAAAVLLLWASRAFFRMALRSYRSASS
ncbi:MAG: ABC-2 family transporter protein [Gemmataceae bacterium]|nr:ABC-2 family transporter protein [Gemmataceae bacterium]